MRRWLAVFVVWMGTTLDAESALASARMAYGKKPEKAVPAPLDPVAPQYDNRVGFSFDRFVFDHNKANCIYFAIDVWMPYFFSHSRNGHYGSLYEGEFRIGYNLFMNGCDHVTPLFGMGYQYNHVGDFHQAKFAYTTAGIRYYHEFNTVVGWGIYLKALTGQQVGQKEKKKFAWGVDLSMPFVFRFGKARHWDITLEPFYLYMETSPLHQAVLGGRGTVGYQF